MLLLWLDGFGACLLIAIEQWWRNRENNNDYLAIANQLMPLETRKIPILHQSKYTIKWSNMYAPRFATYAQFKMLANHAPSASWGIPSPKLSLLLASRAGAHRLIIIPESIICESFEEVVYHAKVEYQQSSILSPEPEELSFRIWYWIGSVATGLVFSPDNFVTREGEVRGDVAAALRIIRRSRV